MAKLVSGTYGEALFETAAEEGRTLALMEEIQTLRQILIDNPEFERLLKHPGIPKQEKAELVERIFRGRVSDELTGFLEIIVEKERSGELSEIFRYFVDRVKEENRIGVAFVTTAVELNELQKQNVETRLLETTSYVKMEMHYSVDPALIGGMVIRINDRVVDSSIRTKINDLTKQLLQIQLG